ncbi:MAG: hypothetical protein JW731_08960 [Bacteroidales bacterium]|nr:hypothetical protein [Bacteroidales bacterium]
MNIASTHLQIQKKPVFISYLLSGRLLHLITCIEIVIILLLVPAIARMDTGESTINWLLKYYAICFILSLPVFSQLDARSRFQNYKKIKDQFFIYGYDGRILNPVLKSRCQRDSAIVAASELGLKSECRDYFRASGYRWYHLFPDFVFQKPQFLFTRYFWQTTFFAPTYSPKADFNTLRESNIQSRLQMQFDHEPA